MTIVLADDRLVQVALEEDQIGVPLFWQFGAAPPVTVIYQSPTTTA